jgi:hypothetical protein
VKLGRLRKPKVVSPSYADFRSKTNEVILLDMGHTRGGNIQEEFGKLGHLKLKSAHCRGANIVTLI